MGNLIDAIYRYFADDQVPLSTKVKLTILALLALVLIDNHYGFSHTVINSYKVDYMMKLEAAKRQYKEDTAFVSRIDHLIEIEHNRKGSKPIQTTAKGLTGRLSDTEFEEDRHI